MIYYVHLLIWLHYTSSCGVYIYPHLQLQCLHSNCKQLTDTGTDVTICMCSCRCVPDYIANRTEGVALPSWCPPLPKPSSYCDCPPPDDVKTAVSYISNIATCTFPYIMPYISMQRQVASCTFNAVVLKLWLLADSHLALQDQKITSQFYMSGYFTKQ